MRRCQWNILAKVCEAEKIDCSKIIKFIKKGDHLMDKYNVCKDDLIKMLFCDKCGYDNEYLIKLHKHKTEIFQKLIKTKHFKSLKIKPAKDTKNRLGSMMAQYLQHLEAEVLITVINKYSQQIEVLMFDGFQISIGVDVDELLKDLKQITGFDWAQKDNTFEPDGWDEIDEDETDYLKWVEDFEKNHFIVNNPFEYYKETEQGLVSYNKNHFKDIYEPQLEHINTWLKDEKRRTYDSFTLLPYQKGCVDPCPENLYNRWKEYDSKIVDLPEDYLPLDLMDLLSQSLCWDNDENERVRQSAWVMNYLAFHIQYPEIKSQVGLVFESPPGCGKDLLMALIQKMLGAHTVVITENPNDLFIGMRTGDNFNKDIEGKKMLVLNEAIGGDIVELMDKIKAHITSQTVHINRKNRETYEIFDFSSFISMTNSRFPVEHHDRRFVKVKGRNWTTESQEVKNEFFKPKWDILNNQDEIDRIFTYLTNIDLKDWQPRKHRLVTKALTDSKMMNHKNSSMFLKDLYEDEWAELDRYRNEDNDRFLTVVDFRKLYLNWLKKYKNQQAVEQTKMNNVYLELQDFGITLARIRPKPDMKLVRVVRFGNLEHVIKNLEAIGIIES